MSISASAPAAGQEWLFVYPLKRRDGERPLSITGGVVALLTFCLAIRALPAHDWRPLAFYLAFCAMSLGASLVLALQWSREQLIATTAGLEHVDWLGRSYTYVWGDVMEAVDMRRAQNERLILRFSDGTTRVIHPDVSAGPRGESVLPNDPTRVVHSGVSDYDWTRRQIGERLAAVGRSLAVDEGRS